MTNKQFFFTFIVNCKNSLYWLSLHNLNGTKKRQPKGEIALKNLNRKPNFLVENHSS